MPIKKGDRFILPHVNQLASDSQRADKKDHWLSQGKP